MHLFQAPVTIQSQVSSTSSTDCTDSGGSSVDNKAAKKKEEGDDDASSNASSFDDLGEAAAAANKSFEIIEALMTMFREERDLSLEATKEILWERHFSDFGRGVAKYRTEEATKLVLKGIPDKFRSEIWMASSGAIHEKHAHPGYYVSMVEKVASIFFRVSG